MSRKVRSSMLAAAVLLAAAWLPCPGHDVPSSRAAMAQAPASPADGPAAPDDAGRKVRAVKSSLQQSEAVIRDLEGRIPKLREEIERLRQQFQGLLRPQDEAPPAAEPKKKLPREESFRPPMERLTKQKPIDFLCENGTISFLDMDPVRERHQALFKRLQSGQAPSEMLDFEIPGSDFRCQGMVHKAMNIEDILSLLRLPGRFGETVATIQQESSQLQRKIAQHKGDTKTLFIQFTVYPDSYDVFRRAREIAWAAGFDVGWDPHTPGDPVKVRFGSGPGGVGVVQ